MWDDCCEDYDLDNMTLEHAIEVLREYVALDRDVRGEQLNYSSDFDEFCEEKCIAIEVVLDKLEELMKE